MPFATPRLEAVAHAALRMVVGALLAIHGAQKLFGVVHGNPVEFFTQVWVGACIELTTGSLMALGLFTRPAAFLASGTMAVAYLQFHWKLQLADFQWAPMVNKGELALVFCFVFFWLAFAGGGPASLGRALKLPLS